MKYVLVSILALFAFSCSFPIESSKPRNSVDRAIPAVGGTGWYKLEGAFDTYVQDGAASSTNFGTKTSLIVKKDAVTGYNRISYIKIGSGIDFFGQITAAELWVYGKNAEDTTSQAVQVWGLDQTGQLTFDSSKVTWKTKPALGTLQSTVNVNGTATTYKFNVSQAVAQWSGLGTVTFALTQGANGKRVEFNSQDATANKPVLWVYAPYY